MALLVSALSVGAWLAWQARASQPKIAPPGTVYEGVSADPGSIGCGLSGGSIPVHRINAGGANWVAFSWEDELRPGVHYAGRLRVTRVGDRELRYHTGNDLAVFEVEGKTVEFGTWAVCE